MAGVNTSSDAFVDNSDDIHYVDSKGLTHAKKFDVGNLEAIFFGPMFSGKTSKLLHRLTTCADVGMNVLYINHSIDNRDTEKKDVHVTTHHSLFNGLDNNKIRATKTSRLDDVDVSCYDVIGVDEGQFFPDIVESVRKWVLRYNKLVFIASLDGDANIQPFGRVHELICLCSPKGLYKLEAKCMNCLSRGVEERHLHFVPAGYSFRKENDRDEGDQEDVGGADKYMALCLKCHQELSSK